jgi:hypothetical protein
MDKEYTTLPPNCIIETLYTNYGIIARCEFAAKKHLRTKFVDVNFDDVPLRSAAARGFKIAEHEVEHVIQIKRGSSSPQGGEDMPPPDGTPVTETQPAETGAPAIGQAAPNQEPTPRAVSEPPASAAVEPPVKSSVSVILTAENTAGKPTKQTSPETRPEPGTPKRGSAKRQPPELVESERGGASAERATPRPMEVAARQPTAIDRTPKASAASPPLPVGKPPAKRKGSTLERVAPAPPPVGKEEGKLTETKSKPLSAPKDSPTKPTQAPATLRSQSVPPPRVQPKLGKPQGPVATVPVAKAKIKPSGKAGTDVKAKPDGGKPLRKLVDEDSPFFLE